MRKTAKLMEPMEHVVIDVPTEYQGSVMQKLGARKGELEQMAPLAPRACALNFAFRRAGCSATAANF